MYYIASKNGKVIERINADKDGVHGVIGRAIELKADTLVTSFGNKVNFTVAQPNQKAESGSSEDQSVEDLEGTENPKQTKKRTVK